MSAVDAFGRMKLLSHQPAPPLAPYVRAIWHYDGYRAVRHRERILPNRTFQLIIEVDSGFAAVSGVRTKYVEINTAPIQSVMGAVFHPGGARAFVDASADEFHNEMVPLDLVWGSGGKKLCERLRETACPHARIKVLESALVARLKPHTVLHSAVCHGLNEFQRVPLNRGVLKVIKDAGLSRRRFGQLFREQVGLTPKLYYRLHRFHWVVEQVVLAGFWIGPISPSSPAIATRLT
jgi:AraC-like DNA-binding protein